jgi:hypothetical protein
MNERERREGSPEGTAEENARGPNLVLIYGIIALALAAAVAIAAMIVLPFYRRR